MATGRSLALSLDRVAEIAGFGFGDVDLSAVPRRRVMELARYGMAGKATLLRRHPKPRKLATLLAAVVHLQAKAIDDALELSTGHDLFSPAVASLRTRATPYWRFAITHDTTNEVSPRHHNWMVAPKREQPRAALAPSRTFHTTQVCQ